MESINNNIGPDEIKEILNRVRDMDMVSYLSKLGYEPVKVSGNDHWYLSPLRSESTASFKVNRLKNQWIDFGGRPTPEALAKAQKYNRKPPEFNGGTLVDFAMQHNNWTIRDLVTFYKGDALFLDLKNSSDFQVIPQEKEHKIKVLSEHLVSSYPLVSYLKERRIAYEIYDRFCKEIRYEIGGRNYYAIGFRNDLGGYEIRNSLVKLSSSPKGITTIDNGADEAAVFEGFFDFLSFMTINQGQDHKRLNYVILNSLSFFESARSFMEKHRETGLYLDQGTSGQSYTRYAMTLSSCYQDKSGLYKNYKDVNDWHVNFGKAQQAVKPSNVKAFRRNSL
ncbi:toprim domain-containing protein [Mucilaginibacter paludis]|nr:toprim domain-containing protein [Mucilaginibacter paludis]